MVLNSKARRRYHRNQNVEKVFVGSCYSLLTQKMLELRCQRVHVGKPIMHSEFQYSMPEVSNLEHWQVFMGEWFVVPDSNS